MQNTDYDKENDGQVTYDKDKNELEDYVKLKKKQSDTLVKSFTNHMTIKSFFEVSCGLGTNILAFEKLGVKSSGSEFGYMMNKVIPEVKSRVREVDLRKLVAGTRMYDLVLCSEVLEHIDEEELGTAIENLKGMTRRHLAVTIPLIYPGYEACASHIWWDGDGKEWARKLAPEELWKKPDGTVSQGHVTMATEKWWTDIFEKHGLYRDRTLELQVIRDFEIGGISPFYNLFIFTRERGANIEEPEKKSDNSVEETFFHKMNWGWSSRVMYFFAKKGGPYKSQIRLENMDGGSTFKPGEMRFVGVHIRNLSSRIFDCDPTYRNRIRVGIRFRGKAHTIENLPIYLNQSIISPGESVQARFQIKAPYNLGQYICEISLVEEGVTWFIDSDSSEDNHARLNLVVE